MDNRTNHNRRYEIVTALKNLAGSELKKRGVEPNEKQQVKEGKDVSLPQENKPKILQGP